GACEETMDGAAADGALRCDAAAGTVLFDRSQAGNDQIADLTEGEDVIVFSSVGLASLGLTEFSGAALDADDRFSLVEDADTGDTVIQHPGGTITLNAVPFEDGQTFADLEGAGLLAFTDLTAGTDGADDLTGTDGDDTIDAMGGDDTITPLDGDDTITTGAGADTINIDPSNDDEGDDVVTDFDRGGGDTINFTSDDLEEADPDLAGADGDDTSISAADFDASQNWTLSESADGNLVLTHPGGSVELGGTAFNNQTFADLASSITVDG